MRILFVILILAGLVLAGCAEAAGPDLYAQAEIAQVTVDYATRQARATQDYQAELDRRATLQAAATQQASQDEIAAIEAEIVGTRAAVDMIQTVAAVTVQAEQRATQAALVQTVQSITATPLAATQIAVVKQATLENERANLRMFVREVIIPLFVLTIIAFSVWMLVSTLTRRMSIQPTPMGVVSLLGPRATLIPYEDPPDLAEDDSLLGDAMAIVQASIKAGGSHGEFGTQLAGWRKVPGMSSSRWQDVIAALVKAGLVRTEPQRGTFVEGDHNLRWVLWQLQSREVLLTPPPPPSLSAGA